MRPARTGSVSNGSIACIGDWDGPVGNARGAADRSGEGRRIVDPMKDVSATVSSDPPETKFLHCAQAAQADYIVTGSSGISGRIVWPDAHGQCRRGDAMAMREGGLRCSEDLWLVTSAPFLLPRHLTSVRTGSSSCRVSGSSTFTVPVEIALASAIGG